MDSVRRGRGRPLEPVEGISVAEWASMTLPERKRARERIRYHTVRKFAKKSIATADCERDSAPTEAPIIRGSLKFKIDLTTNILCYPDRDDVIRADESYNFDANTNILCRHPSFNWVADRYNHALTATALKNKKRTLSGRPLLALPSFTIPELRAWLQPRQDVYIVTDEWKFKMTTERGYYWSLSLDRIDNEKGYSLDNIIPRPLCLNTTDAFTTVQLEHYRRTILNPINHSEWWFHLPKAFQFVHDHDVVKNPEFRIGAFKYFLRRLFVRQGGRCAYTGFPMGVHSHLDLPRCNTVSVERLNPRLPYIETNVVLICRGFNFGVQHRHGRACDEEDLMKNRVWNQAYWDESMGMTPELWAQVNQLRKETHDLYLASLPEHRRSTGF